jgi:hypothetical protein
MIAQEVREHGLQSYDCFPKADLDLTSEDIARSAVQMHEVYLAGKSKLLFTVYPRPEAVLRDAVRMHENYLAGNYTPITDPDAP